jgi:hypothetical protein
MPGDTIADAGIKLQACPKWSIVAVEQGVLVGA